ncbi:hypothetical protein SO802_035754 [Lithocarpus litseifolius]|uniref:50S ribosomal protein L16, chloroplastic n=1 Tax=Lithocarpus litseifolius TaxID=425828 RepID=A0AAW2B8N9_9ROSI
MPLGTAIHNIEITLGKGGQLARAAGAVAKLIAKEGKIGHIKITFWGGPFDIQKLLSNSRTSGYALQALEPAWITSRQIEAGRRAMTRNVRRGGKIWVRIFPDKPVTVRPAETRMGSGKGSPEYWVAIVKTG